ncbi:Blue-light-activated protein [Lacunisphaera limnophila]|uniref:histidine kinase n=1 Tax=Lacunisphaera limnophila TaxID=1838286 RepID=A0A1D8ASY8_9BACT|nr:ATP-binding protein [Lacunisphaera limnophila]AOS44018.1 Blue-light-activated protein [Lacunisphaera limnophila]
MLPPAALAAGFVLGRRRAGRLQRRLDHTAAMLRRISQAVESTSDAIGIGDMQGHSLYHNRAHLELFGYTVDELNAVPGDGVLFADPAVAQEILTAVKGGRSWSGETDVRTRAGQAIPAFVRADIIRDEAGEPVGIYGVFADITERRRRAEEQERTNRLESLGLMAGGIAHDFGNLMTVMSCNLYLAQDTPDLPLEVGPRLLEIDKVIHRATKLTEQLKTFAKGGTQERKLTRLPALVREAARLAVTGSPVRLDDALPADLWPVEVDETQIGQVVHNIVLNAVQAMTGASGCVSLRAVNLEPGVETGLPPTGAWVKVSLADDGPGMPPEVLARIFDPFFTTKKTGTGLGLATSHTIIEKHRGRLRVDSQPGRGTTFHLILPAAPRALAE